MTPAMVHHDQVEAIRAQRQKTLDAVYKAHPERFMAGPPVAPGPPHEVWINPPTSVSETEPPPQCCGYVGNRDVSVIHISTANPKQPLSLLASDSENFPISDNELFQKW